MTVQVSTGFRARLLGPSSFESLFNGGCIEIRSGAQPANANMAPTGTLLGRITAGGLPWTEGSGVNGLTFSRFGHRVTNNPGQSWILDGLANGTAGWFRLRGVSDPGLPSTAIPRIDGALGLPEMLGDYQMRLPTLVITGTTAIPITSWWFVFPPLD